MMNTPFTLVCYLIFIILLYTGFYYRCTFATASAVRESLKTNRKS